MSRRVIFIGICFAFLILGCEKKEPQEERAPAVTRSAFEVPEGMAALRQGLAVYIATKPATVGQYVAYLRATGQAVPDPWQAIQPGAAGANTPVTGLTRTEAGWHATWALKRLPTEDEWKLAASVVGSRPYPWPQGATAGTRGGEIFLVQDWAPGSDRERKARAAREGLPGTILAECTAEINAVRARLQEALARQTARREDLWRQTKPGFFTMLEKQKKVAELLAKREALADVRAVLTRVAREKARLAVKLQTADLSAEAADAEVESYRQILADARTKAQEVRQALQETTRASQDEVVALTRRFEAVAAGEGAAVTAAIPEGASSPPRNIEQATSLKHQLESALQQAQAAGPPFGGALDADDIKARTAQLDEQLDQLAADQTPSDETQTLRENVTALDESINREFLQEKLLFQELDELAGLRARMKAVEAQLNALKQALNRASGAAGVAG